MNEAEILKQGAKLRDLADYKATRVVARESLAAHRAALALCYEAYKDTLPVVDTKELA